MRLFLCSLFLLLCACSSPPPIPTPAPKAATTTSVPTSRPTPVAGSTSTPEEWEYVRKIEALTAQASVSVKRIIDLTNQVNGAIQPKRTIDEAWGNELNEALAQLRTATAELRKLDAPPVFVSVQAHLRSACFSLDEMAQALARGFNRRDSALMSSSNTHFQNAAQSIANARAELERLIQRPADKLQF